jgi:hypothetical protein
MPMFLEPVFRRAGMLLACVMLAACGSQLSLDNYNKLKSGQTYDEVKKIIGEPARCDEMLGIRSCVWGDEQRGISINFVAGQAVLLAAKNLK